MTKPSPPPQQPVVMIEWSDTPNTLKLMIEGYQFPNDSERPGDSWLMVRGEIACAEGKWTFTWQCLAADEIGILADYLERSEPTTEGPEFTEPNLRCSRPSVDEVEVAFALESAPPWAQTRWYDPDRSFRLRFRVPPETLAATIGRLRAAAIAFPLRSV